MRPLALAPLALAACGGDLSNQVFIEDAAFRAALPYVDDLTVVYPNDLDATGLSEDLTFLDTTLVTLDSAAVWTTLFSAVCDTARTYAPSERGDDLRIWGPSPWADRPGYFLRAEMSRTPDEAVYTYSIQAAATSVGIWREFFTGIWYTDPDTASEWQGEATWDLGVLGALLGEDADGEVILHYNQLEDAVELELIGTPTDDRPGTATHLWQSAEGEGLFELRTELDFYGGDTLERYHLTTRWNPEGDGRGETLLSSGDLGPVQVLLSQCWSAAPSLSWQAGADDEAWWPDVGVEDDCTLAATEAE
ncbi:MAG: hypothetical protein H6739_05415 [Alphaproteobacteria bacterium]|nr:hypothetical protein [Alphaproteobacteria bacterium]